MTFTLDHIVNSLAGVLTSRYPTYPVYDSPNPQGTEPPCFFIFSCLYHRGAGGGAVPA